MAHSRNNQKSQRVDIHPYEITELKRAERRAVSALLSALLRGEKAWEEAIVPVAGRHGDWRPARVSK